MIDRTVRLHRPHSDPAPHAAATSFDVDAPLATQSCTTWLVAPVHRQTNMWSDPLADAHQMREPADELSGVCAETGPGHPLRGGVRMVDPLPGAQLVIDLLA